MCVGSVKIFRRLLYGKRDYRKCAVVFLLPYNLTKGSCHLIRRILKCPAPKSAKHQDIDTVINCTLKYIPHPVPVQIQKKCICPVRKSRILLNVQYDDIYHHKFKYTTILHTTIFCSTLTAIVNKSAIANK